MDFLPTEIIIHILSYLPTIDLINFSTAFHHYSHFLKDRRLNEIISFKRMFNLYDFDICGFIMTHTDYNYIKVLNIEGLYWITIQDWRTLLPNLNNLEDLYALDTKLGLKSKDIMLYRSLKKISLTVEAYQLESVISDEYFNVFYGLKKLFIKFISKKDNFDELYCFLSTLQQLTELWICDDDQTYGINYEKIVCYLPNLNKLVIKSARPIPLLDFSCWGLLKIFQNARHEFEVENVFERLSLMDIKENGITSPDDAVEQSWEIFQRLHVDLPCGVHDFELIHFQTDVQNIYFHELNFCHCIVMCDIKYINAALQILSSKNCTKLKRLAFRTCLLLDNKPTDVEEQAPLFKKQRIGLQMKCDNHLFRKIAKNLKSLSHLEITTCARCMNGSVLSSYFLISHFENLQKLCLVVSPLLDGSFLTQVIKACQRLESLYLTCLGQNENFICNMCQALKGAEALRDFRLEHKELAISRILNTFNSIKSKKLLRLFLKCDSLRFYTEGVDIFYDFMQQNPQLVFFFMVINSNKKQNSDIQKILDRYRRGNQAKIFYVKKEATAFTGAFPIPAAHHDIIYNHTDVSVIDFNVF